MIKIEDIKFDEYELVASICRESFYSFVREFWDVVVPEKPIWNWHIKYLCNEIQKVSERVFVGLPKENDLIINVPPGSTKTTICSIMSTPWRWTRMPSAGMIGCSYTYDIALDMSRKARMVVKSEKYQKCFPYVQISGDMDAKGHYVTTKGGERNTVGTDGNVTGRHADFIDIDDPLNPKGARSEADLIKANNFITETLWSRKKDKATTPTVLIMQRLSIDDPTGMMLKLAESKTIRVKHICIPAEKTKDIRPKKLRKYYKNGLMDSRRLPREVLDEAFTFLGEFAYAGQFLQTPVPLGGGMFKTDRITIIEGPPTKWVDKVRFWDKAGTADGGAYTVGLLMSKDRDERYCVEHVVRGRWDSFRREQVIKETAEADGRDVRIGIEQEPGSGGKESAENTVRNLAGWVVDVDKPSGSGSSKIQRADPFSTQVNAGNVSMVRGEWNRDYVDEMTYAPESTYKDQMDASSGAFNLLVVPKRSILVFH